MPANTSIQVPARTWTLLTSADVTNITFQNLGPGSMWIKATAGAVPPADTLGALEYEPGTGELETAMADLAAGVVGANRVYAFTQMPGIAAVSHA